MTHDISHQAMESDGGGQLASARQGQNPSEQNLKQRLVMLNQVGNELSTADSFDALCRQAVVRGHEILEGRRFGLWFRMGDSLTVTGSFGVDEQGRIRDERNRSLIVSPHSPMGQVLAHHQPLLVSEDCPLRDDRGQVVGHGALIVAALWNGARVIGCLCMDNLLERNPLHDHEGELLKLYASTLGHLATRKRAEDALKQSLQEKEILLKEVHHRVKNNLQVISSLLSLQAARVRDPHDMELFRQSQNRVKSMATIYEMCCHAGDLTRVNFHQYLQELVGDLFYAYNVDPSAIALRMEECGETLCLDKAIPCGLIVHELVSNALRHGFNIGKTPGEQSKGEITIAMRRKDHYLSMVVGDNGAAFPDGVDIRHPASLGLQLVNALVAQLNGSVTLERTGGALFTITFPDQH